jgi:hypothetical protein
MRDVLHIFASAIVIAVAAVCTLVQVSDVDHAIDRLHDDGGAVVQQVGFEGN